MTEPSEEQEIKMKDIFDELDLDENESIDLHELRRGAQLYALNPSEGEVEEALKAVDLDYDSRLNFEEFRTLLTVSKLVKSEDVKKKELYDSFLLILDGMGIAETDTITKDTFREIMQNTGKDPLTAEEVDDIFADVDTDGDKGTLTIEELVNLFTKQSE